MVMDVPSSLGMVIVQENSNMRSNVDKSVLTYQFQYLYLCFHSLVAKAALWAIAISMVRELSHSILNGRQSQQDGRKSQMMLKNYRLIFLL